MKKRTLALCAAVWIAFLPYLALAQSSNTVGNTGSPSAGGGIRLLGTDGTNDYQVMVDASGRVITTGPYPVMEVIQHFSNRTVTSATPTDSSGTPFSTAGYRQVYMLLRNRASTVAASAAVEIAIRGHLSALMDSTQGWWFPIGGGAATLSRGGRTLFLNDFGSSRFRMIALADSVTGVPFQAPYCSMYLINRTGANVQYDLWFLGVR